MDKLIKGMAPAVSKIADAVIQGRMMAHYPSHLSEAVACRDDELVEYIAKVERGDYDRCDHCREIFCTLEFTKHLCAECDGSAEKARSTEALKQWRDEVEDKASNYFYIREYSKGLDSLVQRLYVNGLTNKGKAFLYISERNKGLTQTEALESLKAQFRG